MSIKFQYFNGEFEIVAQLVKYECFSTDLLTERNIIKQCVFRKLFVSSLLPMLLL